MSTAVFPGKFLALFPVFVSSISFTKLSKRPAAFETMSYSPSKTAAWSRLNPDCSSTRKKALLERFLRETYDGNDYVFEKIIKRGIYLALLFNYRKIPRISPSKYKPPNTPKYAKNLPLNRPSKYRPPGGLYLEISLKYKAKQRKTANFPPYISPSKNKPLKMGL